MTSVLHTCWSTNTLSHYWPTAELIIYGGNCSGGKCAPPPYFKPLSRTTYINRAVRTVILVIYRSVEVTPLNIRCTGVRLVVYSFPHSWTSGSLDIKYTVNISSLKLDRPLL